MNIKLPKSLRQKTLQDMKVGEVVWTLPWGMYAENDETLWLNGNYPVSMNQHGTFEMQVTKTSQGYICDVSKIKGFSLSLGACFAGEFTPLPVCDLIGCE